MFQVVIEIPYIFVQTMIYGSVVYAMIGYEWMASKFLWYLYIMFFTLSYFTFYGMMTAAMTPDPQISSIISIAAYSLWNLFSGFVIPRPVSKPWMNEYVLILKMKDD